MVRLLYGLRRWPGASLKEFHEHWLDHHVERFGRPIRQIRRYVLYAAVDDQPALGRAEPLDGIASVWFDDVATLKATMDSAMPEAAVDEARFIDHDRSRAVLVDDHVIVEPDAPAPIVLFDCLVRSAGTLPADFAAAWLQSAGQARREYADGLLQGYVQSHVRCDAGGGVDQFDALGAPGTERWDGIEAAYFDSVVAARRYLERSGGGLPTGTDADFVDHDRTTSILARRHPRRDPIR